MADFKHGNFSKPFQSLNCDELEEILLENRIKPEVCQVLKSKALLIFVYIAITMSIYAYMLLYVYVRRWLTIPVNVSLCLL